MKVLDSEHFPIIKMSDMKKIQVSFHVLVWVIEILCNSAVTCKRLTKKSLLERTGPTDSEECKENSKQGIFSENLNESLMYGGMSK